MKNWDDGWCVDIIAEYHEVGRRSQYSDCRNWIHNIIDQQQLLKARDIFNTSEDLQNIIQSDMENQVYHI